MSDATAATPSADASLKPVILIAYALFAFGLVNGITAVVGVVLAYVKRGEAQGTVWQSHCRNLIHLFWTILIIGALFALVLLQAFGGFLGLMNQTDGHPGPGLVALAVLALPVIYVASIATLVYYIYRVMRGLIRALESRAY